MKCQECGKDKKEDKGYTCQPCREQITKDFWGDVRKKMTSKMPKGWYLYTIACPIQYMKDVTIKGQKYQGYLRSRWGHQFSIEINKVLDNNGMWETFWETEPVDNEDVQPPVKSMKLVDKQFERMKKCLK